MTSNIRERIGLLTFLERKLEMPMLILSFLWLILMILEFTSGLSSFLQILSNFIWFLFILDFIAKISLAPKKISFLKRNWVTALALALPAFRLLRIVRVARVIRVTGSIRLARILTSLSRGIRALGKTLGKRGFGYVLLLSLLVTLAGAAGIFAFEKEQGYLTDYGSAVWWTAMLLTTMGSDYFPKTAEGRILCLLLATYGFAIFGYVTATVATFFVSEDSKKGENRSPQSEKSEVILKKISDLEMQIKKLQNPVQ
jgi:voltage-gated potassium channel